MAAKSYEEIIRDLKNKIYSPVYLLHGEEPYYIDKISDNIESSVLDEMEKEFNQTIIYGRDAEPLSLISTAKRYPMMSNYQVVIVKEAQDMQYFKRKKEDDKADADPLVNYFQKPLTSTLFVWCFKYKTFDKRTKLYKAIDRHATVFEGKKIYENKIPEWIHQYINEKGFKIQDKAAQLMAESLGADLSRIANECDKLFINLKAGQEITTTHIEQNIGISKDFNSLELNAALANKNTMKAYRIINYFKVNPKSSPMPLTMGSLYYYFSKLLQYHALTDRSPFAVSNSLGVASVAVPDFAAGAKNYPVKKVAHIIGLLHEYDLKSKGVNNTSAVDGDLLKELAYKIMH